MTNGAKIALAVGGVAAAVGVAWYLTRGDDGEPLSMASFVGGAATKPKPKAKAKTVKKGAGATTLANAVATYGGRAVASDEPTALELEMIQSLGVAQ